MRDTPKSPPPLCAIDIGTNSVKCLVARVSADAVGEPLLDTLVTTRLGEGLQKTGRLGSVPIERTSRAVADLAGAARRLGARRIRATATSAAREAVNSADLLAAIDSSCGITVDILDGEEEARLMFLGAVGRRPERSAVLDLGGGSTEWATGKAGRVTWRTSYPVGAVRITEAYLKRDPPLPEDVLRAVAAVTAAFAGAPRLQGQVVGVGGTVRTLTEVDLAGRGIAEGSVLTAESVRRQIALYRSLSVPERREVACLPPDRADIVLGGALVLDGAMKQARIEGVTCTLRGLRHGSLLDLAAQG